MLRHVARPLVCPIAVLLCVTAWGQGQGLTSVISNVETFPLHCGYEHCCAISNAGGVVCWYPSTARSLAYCVLVARGSNCCGERDPTPAALAGAKFVAN